MTEAQKDLTTARVTEQATLLAHRMFEHHREALAAAGAIQTHAGYQRLSSVALVHEYERLMESKAYLGVPYTDEHGNLVTTQNIKEFCREFMPYDDSWFRQQRALLDTLGADVVDWLSDLHVSRRKMTMLKHAPADFREGVAAAIESGDTDTALALIDQCNALAAEEQRRSVDLENRVEAQDKIIARKEQRINDLDEQLAARDAAADRHGDAANMQVEIIRAAADAHDALALLEACRNTFLGSDELPDLDVSMLAVTTYDLVEQVYAAAQELMTRCEYELSGYRSVVLPAGEAQGRDIVATVHNALSGKLAADVRDARDADG